MEDVINLQWRMETAYNLTVSHLPIQIEKLHVAKRPVVDLPFDPSVIAELNRRM